MWGGKEERCGGGEVWGEGRCGVVRREVCVEDEGRFGMVVERSGDVGMWRWCSGGNEEKDLSVMITHQ